MENHNMNKLLHQFGSEINNNDKGEFYVNNLQDEILNLKRSVKERDEEITTLKELLSKSERIRATLQKELDETFAKNLGVQNESNLIRFTPKAKASPGQLRSYSSVSSLSCIHQSAAQPKKNHQAIFVGNLTHAIEKKELEDYFGKYGEIVYSTFPKRGFSSGNGLHYAFVKFKSVETVEKIMMKKDEHKIKNVKVLVNYANKEMF